MSVSELALAAEAQNMQRRETRFLKHMCGVACWVIVSLTAAAFFLGLAAIEYTKDMKPKEGGAGATRRRRGRGGFLCVVRYSSVSCTDCGGQWSFTSSNSASTSLVQIPQVLSGMSCPPPPQHITDSRT